MNRTVHSCAPRDGTNFLLMIAHEFVDNVMLQIKEYAQSASKAKYNFCYVTNKERAFLH